MPRGIKKDTDEEMYEVLTRQTQPLTIQQLMMITNWSQGKVANSIKRLEKETNNPLQVVTVKVDPSRGQSKLYIGLANENYWMDWYNLQHDSGSKIINDTFGVFKESQMGVLHSNDDPSKLELVQVVLDEYSIIKEAAATNDMNEVDFLRGGIRYLCHPRFPEILREIRARRSR